LRGEAVSKIVFEHIRKRYRDGFEAVRDMNLEIADGEFMVLVGPSGSGKSTALRLVAGLEDITAGKLKIDGEVVNEREPRDRDIAMVFQNYALYPHMTVRQNMAFPLRLAKAPRDQVERKVREASRILDLEQHLDRKPAQLSGGQRQRVAMGRAIVRDPKAFLLDEPLSNLDAKLRVQTRTEISRIQHRLETTTIYVTHDQTEALTLGDRIAVMRAGRLQQVGPPAELYNEPENLFVAGFIGSPAMNFLPGQLESGAVRIALGEVPIPDGTRRRLESAQPEAGRAVIVGIRPEHFQDASLVGDHAHGHTFTAKVDVLESLGSEYYAHFTVASDRVSANELEELAEDAGSAEIGRSREGVQVVARLDAASRAAEGGELELWFDPERLQLFDPENGRSLLAPPSSATTAPATASDAG
jgi:multiple sugar transport system ATP-binding protein